MDKLSVTEKIIALETAALEAWLNGNPTPCLNLYSKDFTYFDPAREWRLDLQSAYKCRRNDLERELH